MLLLGALITFGSAPGILIYSLFIEPHLSKVTSIILTPILGLVTALASWTALLLVAKDSYINIFDQSYYWGSLFRVGSTGFIGGLVYTLVRNR